MMFKISEHIGVTYFFLHPLYSCLPSCFPCTPVKCKFANILKEILLTRGLKSLIMTSFKIILMVRWLVAVGKVTLSFSVHSRTPAPTLCNFGEQLPSPARSVCVIISCFHCWNQAQQVEEWCRTVDWLQNTSEIIKIRRSCLTFSEETEFGLFDTATALLVLIIREYT